MLLDVWQCVGLIFLPWTVCGSPPCWWQESQTRTGFLPQPLSGTGMLRVEQAWQKPSPQARQWCFLSTSLKTRLQPWHSYRAGAAMSIRSVSSNKFLKQAGESWEVWTTLQLGFVLCTLCSYILVSNVVLDKQCLMSEDGDTTVTYCNFSVRSPIRWSNLICDPGRDGFGGTGAVLWHRLQHVVNPV